jgi:hypothetical protein
MPPSTPPSRLPRIKAFVAELLQELPKPTAGDALATAATTRQKQLKTVLTRCGARLATAAVLKEIETELGASGVYTHRPISSPALRREDWVKFSRLPFAADELFFENEALLKEYLRAGIGSFGPLKDLELEAAEFYLPSRRRVDLLCRERRRDNRGALVAIELKKAKQADGVVTQLVRYLEELSKHALAKDRTVRGMIISGQADHTEARQLVAETRFQIDWHTYVVNLPWRASSPVKSGEKAVPKAKVQTAKNTARR